MRAADVAATLGIPANQASFHLRQLAKYGLVEEDPAAARDRRDRVWKVTEEHGMTVELRDIERTPGGKAAAAVFLRSSAAGATRSSTRLRRQPATRHHRSVTEQAVRLTKAEARELTTSSASWWTPGDRNARTRGRAADLPALPDPAAVPRSEPQGP